MDDNKELKLELALSAFNSLQAKHQASPRCDGIAHLTMASNGSEDGEGPQNMLDQLCASVRRSALENAKRSPDPANAFAQLEAENIRYANESAAIRSDLSAMEKVTRQLQNVQSTMVNQLQSEVHSLRAENVDLTSRVTALNSEVESLRSDKTRAETEREVFIGRFQQLKAENSDLQKQISDLRNETDTFRARKLPG